MNSQQEQSKRCGWHFGTIGVHPCQLGECVHAADCTEGSPADQFFDREPLEQSFFVGDVIVSKAHPEWGELTVTDAVVAYTIVDARGVEDYQDEHAMSGYRLIRHACKHVGATGASYQSNFCPDCGAKL